GGDVLNGMAVVSATDIWAVGYYDDSGVLRTFIEQWNGTNWSVVPSPNANALSNILFAATASGPNDVWAVGSYNDTGGQYESLTLHWNGTSWSVVPSPNVGSLYGVSLTSSNDVWALNQGIIHWDGSAWSVSATPPGSYLDAVAAISSNDAWA